MDVPPQRDLRVTAALLSSVADFSDDGEMYSQSAVDGAFTAPLFASDDDFPKHHHGSSPQSERVHNCALLRLFIIVGV